MNDDYSSRASLEVLPIVKVLFLVYIELEPNITGYELSKKIHAFTNQNIELKSGTTYTELRRLEKDELVTSEQNKTGRRKRMYSITSKGKKEIQRLIGLIKYRVHNILIPLVKLYETKGKDDEVKQT